MPSNAKTFCRNRGLVQIPCHFTADITWAVESDDQSIWKHKFIDDFRKIASYLRDV